MSAHLRRCDACGREDTRGFQKVGHQFSLRGRTRLAQRLNMRSGPAIWECTAGFGCNADKRWKRERWSYVRPDGATAYFYIRTMVAK